MQRWPHRGTEEPFRYLFSLIKDNPSEDGGVKQDTTALECMFLALAWFLAIFVPVKRHIFWARKKESR